MPLLRDRKTRNQPKPAASSGFSLARYPEYGANRPYLVDSIQICLAPKYLDYSEIRELYVQKGQSVNQIAARFKVSRTVILARLHDMGIREGAAGKLGKRSTNPENYRCHVPPYGFSVRDGKLVPNRQEMKICRLIVELATRQNKTNSEIARELSRLGYQNRAGKTIWDSKTVFNIHKRWKDKL